MIALVPCHVPKINHGIFKLSVDGSSPLILDEAYNITNGQVVDFDCATGYNIQGPGNLRCYHGEWTGTSLPECVPCTNYVAFPHSKPNNVFAAPCQLPQINNGQYLSGYRAGLTIANGSNVIFQCDSDYHKSPAQPVECILGRLHPRNPTCKASFDDTLEGTNAKTTSPYFGGGDVIIGGDITVLAEYASGQKPCGPPAR